MSSYFDELTKAMTCLAENPRAIFIGQGVGIAGTTLTDSLRYVPPEKLLEFPVAEDLQMGMAIGMALDDWLPICIFPRWNFLLLAANQLVNHLDRLPIYSRGGYRPRVIIRVAAPAVNGFDPGPQHSDDFTVAFRCMLKRVKMVTVDAPSLIVDQYKEAAIAPHSTIMVEYTALYNQVPSGVKDGELQPTA
jgi:pyruvate/2-oxoglutarate/acetoin dehydrogenase E1 component